MGQELRPYQQQARERIHAEWEAGHTRTLLVLPTGTGKTIVFASVAADQVRRPPVLILAHRASCWNRQRTSCSAPPALSAQWKRPDAHLSEYMVPCGGGQRADPAAHRPTGTLPS